jgi:hypothetical protein
LASITTLSWGEKIIYIICKKLTGFLARCADSQGSASDAHSLGAVVAGHIGLEMPGGEKGLGDAAKLGHVIAGIDRP